MHSIFHVPNGSGSVINLLLIIIIVSCRWADVITRKKNNTMCNALSVILGGCYRFVDPYKLKHIFQGILVGRLWKKYSDLLLK